MFHSILFAGPEWKLDGGPGYDDSRAHFGPFDPPSPHRFGPPEGGGYPENSSLFGPGEGNGIDFILVPPDGWGTVLH